MERRTTQCAPFTAQRPIEEDIREEKETYDIRHTTDRDCARRQTYSSRSPKLDTPARYAAFSHVIVIALVGPDVRMHTILTRSDEKKKTHARRARAGAKFLQVCTQRQRSRKGGKERKKAL